MSFEYRYFDGGQFVVSKKVASTRDKAIKIYKNKVNPNVEKIVIVEETYSVCSTSEHNAWYKNGKWYLLEYN